MEKYLKSPQNYSDLYDRHTVDVCRRLDKPNPESVPTDEKLSKRQIESIIKGEPFGSPI